MVKRIGFIVAIIIGLGFLNYLFTAITGAFSGLSPLALPSLIGPAAVGASGGLSSVDFNFFAKGGKGWNFITQGYGVTPFSYLYVGHWHDGIDIAASYGAPIYSPADGIVIATGNQDNYCYRRGFGKYVAVEDDVNHVVLWFAHMNEIAVTPLQTIKKGALLGTVGNTGYETGTHLHFSIFLASGFSMKNKNGCGPDPDGKDVNPIPYLQNIYH
jgi:murein DD-endopeptidase MepM/ murein hydrolase activator NlpD